MYSNSRYISQVYRGWLHSLGTRSAVDLLKVFSTSPHLHNLDSGRRSRKEDVNILLKVNPTLHGYQGYLHLDNNAWHKKRANLSFEKTKNQISIIVIIQSTLVLLKPMLSTSTMVTSPSLASGINIAVLISNLEDLLICENKKGVQKTCDWSLVDHLQLLLRGLLGPRQPPSAFI